MSLPAVIVGVGVLIVSAVTGEVVNIDVYDIVVVNLSTVTVGIGDVLVVSEVIKEVICVIPKG